MPSLRIAGRGDVPVRVAIRLTARRTADGRTVELDLAPPADQAVELPDGVGRARVRLQQRAEPDGAVAFRLACEAEPAEGWVFHEAALSFAVDAAGWGLVLPSGWGRYVADVPGDLAFVGSYPGWSACAQLVILQAAAGGLSVSARDPALELKELRCRRHRCNGRDQLVVEIARVPEARGGGWRVDGECDVLLAPHAGGWDAAAADYRRRQEQVRPALRSRRPLHPLLAADPVWLTQNCFVFPPHTARETIAAARAMGCPVLCHLYNWQDAPFDTRYPDWVGLRAEAVEQVRALAAAKIPCVPYTNARCWDTTTASWSAVGRQAAVRDAAGEPITETYPTSKIPLGVACPSQGAWQDKVLAVCRELADSGLGLPGVYLDQLGAAFGQRCYSRRHGHPAGGARSWNAGQRQLVRRARALLASRPAGEPILTTENASEPLVDLIDGFLYYCGKRDDRLGCPAPLWQAVYGDHGVPLAQYFDEALEPVDGAPSPQMLWRVGLQAIFGSQLGWLSPQFITGAYESVGRLIRHARAARQPILDFVRRGRPVAGALDSTGGRTGVLQSAWRSDGGTVALAVNSTSARRSFAWPDGAKDTLAPLAAAHRRID
jgi:hypothetical protein